MNKIERIIYNAVKKKPWLKLLIRNIYQGLFDLMPRRKTYHFNSVSLKEGYFFGFHDLNPFSRDNSKVLANELSIDFEMPGPKDNVKVGYFDFDGQTLGSFNSVGESKSWNYHKGCRIQWLNTSELIFNQTDEKDILKAKIINISTKESRILSYPIDSVSADGNLASTFSYERLEKYMPGYGYCFQDNDSYLNQKAPENSGIFLLDINSDSRRMLVSLAELANLSRNEEVSLEGNHYVTHSLFSPSGKYLSFFHRWVGSDTRKRYTRLIIYDLHSGTYYPAPTGYMVSHYVWNKKDQIIAYCNYRNLDSHVLLDISDLEKSHSVAYPGLNSDGHQSFINDSSFVTDSYPDRFRMAHLYRVNIVSDDIELLASVYSPEKFQTKTPTRHIACDLHPRVSDDGKYVCYDTAQTGKRAIAVMSLEKK